MQIFQFHIYSIKSMLKVLCSKIVFGLKLIFSKKQSNTKKTPPVQKKNQWCLQYTNNYVLIIQITT